MTYRQRYYTTLQPMAVLDVLMADETNPRSLTSSWTTWPISTASCRVTRRPIWQPCRQP